MQSRFLLYNNAMKLVVMSDSHGRDEMVRRVIKENRDADYFLHAGDLCSDEALFPEVIFVRGNNDWYSDFPKQRLMRFNNVRIYMTHSDGMYGSSRYQRLAQIGKTNNCQLVIFGHTHCWYDETIDGVRILNPGSLLYNRDGSQMGYYIIYIENGEYRVTRKFLD